jgi:carbon monoxide dehydrogenase subunit G
MEITHENLSDGQIKQMRGEIPVESVFLENDVIGITGKIFIDAGIRKVWNVLTDYSNLGGTLPKITRSLIVEENGTEKTVEQSGKTGIFIFEKTVHFTLKVREDFPHRIDFRQIRGDFHVYEGSWILEAHPDGQSTFLTYEARIKPAFFAPPILVSFVQRQDLPNVLKAIKTISESPVQNR